MTVRRVFAVFFALMMALPHLASAQSPQVRALLLRQNNVPIGTFDPATSLWVAAVNTAGGTVSGGRQIIVNTFVVCMKTASLFSIFDRYWLMAGEDAPSAKVDIIARQQWTLNGTYAFSASNGYTGDGSTGYADTGFNPNTAGGNFQLNDASAGVQLQTNRTTGNGSYAFGAIDTGFTTGTTLVPFSTGLALFARVNGITTTGNAPPSSVRASWAITRQSSGGTTIYQNGSSYATTSDVSVSLTPANIFISALNFNGPFSGSFSTDQTSAFWLSKGMSSGQISSFETCHNAMMTSIGINVH